MLVIAIFYTNLVAPVILLGICVHVHMKIL